MLCFMPLLPVLHAEHITAGYKAASVPFACFCAKRHTCAAAMALSEKPMRLCTGGIAMRPLVSEARSTAAVSP
jgi:hypothetical protein